MIRGRPFFSAVGALGLRRYHSPSVSGEPILVVGAGPVGLTAAHRLARHGATVRIIDAATGPSTTSKALVVWRRTLTVLDATIPFERFAEAGFEGK